MKLFFLNSNSKVLKKVWSLACKLFPMIAYMKLSYSQDGEDRLIRTLFQHHKDYKGFYVDVGAYHPFEYSNTVLLYQKGWTGINIEPNPEHHKLFMRFRKRDLNLNIGIGLSKGNATQYLFNKPALNSFDRNLSYERDLRKNNDWKIVGTLKVTVDTLSNILDRSD